MRVMIKFVHRAGGAIAILTIATFWISTALSEVFGSAQTVTAIKTAIPWGFLLLIPAIAATGALGVKLASGSRTGLAGKKLKRMPIIAANGLLVLIPSALFLAYKAKAGAFDAGFYGVQALELLAGAVNISLLGLNMRDGLRMSSGRSGESKQSTAVPLVSREAVAEGTIALRIAKPAGFTHLAGQSITLSLTGPSLTDAKGNSRQLTVASAPHEPELMVAIRVRGSEFKRTLKDLAIGSPVRVSGASGRMTLHEDALRPAVFIAGGIGITPFLAMVRHAAHAKLPHRIVLFYSNRRPEDAAFLAELQQLEETYPNFRLIATMTDAPGWVSERGMINAGMLYRHVPDVRAPIYYFAGPGPMVTAMGKMLRAIGVAPKDMRSEAFYGY
jgi:ferredoxin-NADP reductase